MWEGPAHGRQCHLWAGGPGCFEQAEQATRSKAESSPRLSAGPAFLPSLPCMMLCKLKSTLSFSCAAVHHSSANPDEDSLGRAPLVSTPWFSAWSCCVMEWILLRPDPCSPSLRPFFQVSFREPVLILISSIFRNVLCLVRATLHT